MKKNTVKSETFAIDFDGTLCTNAWPFIGEPCYDMIDWVKQLRKDGHKIILWTCREGMSLVYAIVWCATHGLFFDAVNDNLEEHKKQYKNNSRKIHANYYVDDKGIYPSAMPFIFETPTEFNPTDMWQ
jgi:hypothetical protein